MKGGRLGRNAEAKEAMSLGKEFGLYLKGMRNPVRNMEKVI